MRPFFLTACMVLLPTFVDTHWAQSGQPSPDAPNRKSIDGFSAQLFVISHLPEFIKEWTTSPPEHVPHVPVVSKAKRGDALAITLFFVGCKVDTSGRCNAVYDLTIVEPDGSTIRSFPGLELWKKEAPPNSSNVQLGAAIPQVKFDKSQPTGMYRIRAVVRDENRHVALELETTLDIK